MRETGTAPRSISGARPKGHCAAAVAFLVMLSPVACMATPAATDGAPGAARITVERLLFMADGYPLTPLPEPDWPEILRRGVARDEVSAFMAGVIDNGEGEQWCVGQSGVPPHEVDTRIVAALRLQAQPKAGAARAVAALLTTFYPCQRAR